MLDIQPSRAPRDSFCTRWTNRFISAGRWVRSHQKPIAAALIALLAISTSYYLQQDQSTPAHSQNARPLITLQSMNCPNLDEFICRKSMQMSGNVCNNISNEEFMSLTPAEIQAFKTYMRYFKCKAVTDRLFSATENDLRIVAEQMGALNPAKFNVDRDNVIYDSVSLFNPAHSSYDKCSIAPLWIDNESVLHIGGSYIYSLQNWNGPYSRKEALGILAHEVAHRALLHAERSIVRALLTKQIFVESPEDVSELLNALKSGSYPQKESAKQLLKDVSYFMKQTLARDFPPNIADTVFLSLVRPKDSFEQSRSNEFEADLYTLKDPILGRGLRDSFQRQIINCPNCYHLCTDSETHPSMMSRVALLTENICRIYKEQNKDIC